MNYIHGERLPVTIAVTLGGKQYEAMFDAHIDSKEDYSIDTPTYPIEKDFDTSISTLNHQIQLSMNLFLTPYPVTWASFFGRSIEAVKETLIRMYWLHYPVTIRTQDETYEHMAIKSMTFKRSADTGDAYDVSMTFVHVKPTAFRMGQMSRGAGFGINSAPPVNREEAEDTEPKESTSIFNTEKLEVTEDTFKVAPFYLLGLFY